jgi:pimeloyl-ACP methyl ester carboxylesterase
MSHSPSSKRFGPSARSEPQPPLVPTDRRDNGLARAPRRPARAGLKRLVLAVVLLFAMQTVFAAVGDLPRRSNAAPEAFENVTLELGSVRDSRGQRLRTLITVPHAEGKLPAIFLAGWLSCDSVEIPATGGDGVARLLRQLITDSGAIVARMDKPGVGDSEGNCAETDFDTELSGYRAAFRAVRAHPRVDPTRIVLLGISNGGGFSPLVADSTPVAAFVSIGGWSKTWFEHMIELERRRLALEARPRAAIGAEAKQLVAFHAAYLLDRHTPAEVIRLKPALKSVWYDEPEHQYGRPAAYYHQLQALDLTTAWSKVAVPTLVVWGEYDWIMSRDDQTLIVDSVNANAPGKARLLTVPRMDHSFSTHATAKAAFDRMGTGDYPQAAATEIIAFIRKTVAN